MAEPASVAQALNAAAPSSAFNLLRLDALGSLAQSSSNGTGAWTNTSGATLAVGAVVIRDTANANSVKTTTTASDQKAVGVVVDGSIINAATGVVQTRGIATVNVTGAVAIGDYLVTSTTAGLAQSAGGTPVAAAFAVALTAAAGGVVTGLLIPAIASTTQTTATNVLSGDVTLTTQNTYYDGPSMAQGTVGTWEAIGSVLLYDSGGAAIFSVKLWDGTTVISSTQGSQTVGANPVSVTLAGQLPTPAGNIRISVTNTTRNGGSIRFNLSGNSKDGYIFGKRIG